VVSFLSQPLNPWGKNTPVSIGWEAGWAPVSVWMQWQRGRKFLLLPGIEPLSSIP